MDFGAAVLYCLTSRCRCIGAFGGDSTLPGKFRHLQALSVSYCDKIVLLENGVLNYATSQSPYISQ